MIKTTFNFQLKGIRKNLLVSVCIALTSFAVLYVGCVHHTLVQSITYLAVMAMSAFMIDMYALHKPVKDEFNVRNAKLEAFFFAFCLLMACLFFYIRFWAIKDWEHVSPFVKLGTMGLAIFIYPIALAIIFLLLKYKPKELGFRWHGIVIALPIIALVIIATKLFAPDAIMLSALIKESGGIFGALFAGFIQAALSEEFFRMIGQTRLGKLFNNIGLAWFVIAIIWAFMHAPIWHHNGESTQNIFLSGISLIPLGLMWGYLTHRTKSILPAILVHGTNYWGLQNF